MTAPLRTDTSHAEAVAEARRFIAARHRGDWHSVASVVLTASGARYLGVNLDSTLPRASVCAEPVALGMAMAADPDDRVVFCAAVNRRADGVGGDEEHRGPFDGRREDGETVAVVSATRAPEGFGVAEYRKTASPVP